MVSTATCHIATISFLLGILSHTSYVCAASFVTNAAGCAPRASTANRDHRGLFSSSSVGTTTSLGQSAAASMECPSLPPIPPTKKRLFLVRHGEVINPGGDRPVYYGALDVPLSKLGEIEAKAAGGYLARFDLQHTASSPLSRAIFGGNEVVAQQRTRTELKILPGLRELDRGSWAGRTKAEIGREAMARFDAGDESATPEGGESYATLMDRVLAARDELLGVTECGSASAVVSHLQVTRSLLGDALGVRVEELAVMKVATASVTCIDYDDVSGEQTVHFQSYKPDIGLEKSVDYVN